MTPMDIRVRDLTTRVATEIKSIRMMLNVNALDLSGLTTPAKTDLVSSINSANARMDTLVASMGAMVDDTATASATHTWSVTKIASELTKVKNDITSGSANTLQAIASINAALANEDSAVAAMLVSISNRVRFDAAMSLTVPQQAQAVVNIGAVAASDIGSTSTDYVALFNSGLSS